MQTVLRQWTCACILILLSTHCFAVEIYGHRGAAGLSPENTLVGYRTALNLNVDVLDIDVTITKDNVVVAYHDLKLNPDYTQINGHWLDSAGPAIKDLPFLELQAYDVGSINPLSTYSKNFPYQLSVKQSTIPTLKSIIQMTKKINPKIRYQIEIKTDPFAAESSTPENIIPALVKILKDENVETLSEVHSFDWRNLLLLEKIAPTVKRSYISDQSVHLGNQAHQWTAGNMLNNKLNSFPKLIKALGGHIWCPSKADITQKLVQEAHALGLKVTVWSVDDPKEMLNMIRMGVDGIITNRPDLLLGVQATQHL